MAQSTARTPAPVEIRSLDDLSPLFAGQSAKPGMQISPVTPPMGSPVPVDPTALTPAWNVNDAVSALNDVRQSQKAAAEAASTALTANKTIQQWVYGENVREQDNVLQAYDKLQRIERNPLADLFALFDPKTWSRQHQLLDIEKAQLRSQQTTMRGQSLININNQLPQLKQAEVEAAQAGFQATKDMFSIVQNVTELSQKEFDLRLKATDLRLKLSQEDRLIRDDALKAMTVAQAKSELRRAQAGQGDWADLTGLLEEKIATDEKRQLDIASIQQNLRASRFDLAQKQMQNLISGIEFTEGQQLVEQALSTGQQVVNYQGVPIPLGIMINGVEQARKNSEALTAASLANSSFVVNEKLQKLVVQNSALALTNPQAANNLQAIARFKTQLDQVPPELRPQAMQRFNAFLDTMQGQTDAHLKTAQSNFTTPQAKAAYEEFIRNGAPNPSSAHAVVEEALAQPGISDRSKLGPVWDILRKDYADRVQQLNPNNMPKFNTNSPSGVAQMMAWLTRNPNKKLEDIRAEIVQGGQHNEAVNTQVSNIFEMDAAKNVLDVLSTAPGPGASVYLNMVRDQRRFLEPDGSLNLEAVSTYLAQQTVLNGSRTDYLQTFIDGLRTHATQADSITADPSMTAEDLHLLTTMYGPNPTGSIMSSFISTMSANARSVRENMQRWIQEDVTGETQRRALLQYDPEVIADQNMRQKILSEVPSATGIGTADEMKAIHATDPRFGSNYSGRR